MLSILGAYVQAGREFEVDAVRLAGTRLYGDRERAWRGVRPGWAVQAGDQAESDEERERGKRDFEREVPREIEQVREELEICELEQKKAEQAARLPEAVGRRNVVVNPAAGGVPEAVDRPQSAGADRVAAGGAPGRPIGCRSSPRGNGAGRHRGPEGRWAALGRRRSK